MISKKLWIHNVTESLKEIASEEFQIKGWVKNEVHDYCTFLETKCGFLMDADIEGFLEHAKEFGLSDDQTKKLNILKNAFEEYANEHWGFSDPVFIINDPKWHKIRALAKEALTSLGITHYLDPSKSILKDSLLTYILWISEPLKNTPQPNRFEYLMNCFFKSKVEKIIADYQTYEIMNNRVKMLKDLYDCLKVYRDKMQNEKDFEKVSSDPEWHQIQDQAKEVIKAFNYKQFPDEDEA